MQALGRARGINRTAKHPLHIEIWSDVVLPITVHEVVPWKAVRCAEDTEMRAEGVILESPSDMARCWPGVWAKEQVAKTGSSRTRNHIKRNSTVPRSDING